MGPSSINFPYQGLNCKFPHHNKEQTNKETLFLEPIKHAQNPDSNWSGIHPFLEILPLVSEINIQILNIIIFVLQMKYV